MLRYLMIKKCVYYEIDVVYFDGDNVFSTMVDDAIEILGYRWQYI